ncbi:MAG: ribonuclease P protein component [bacterium]|nr:ribonuclease P protein component [bacterium]
MFSRQHRLGSQGATFTLKRGKGLSGPFLRIKGVSSRGKDTQATVVVGLAVSKLATVRNRIKRRVREILRPFLSGIQPPVNFMVFAGKGAEKRTFKELQTELHSLLRRAGLIR